MKLNFIQIVGPKQSNRVDQNFGSVSKALSFQTVLELVKSKKLTDQQFGFQKVALSQGIAFKIDQDQKEQESILKQVQKVQEENRQNDFVNLNSKSVEIKNLEIETNESQQLTTSLPNSSLVESKKGEQLATQKTKEIVQNLLLESNQSKLVEKLPNNNEVLDKNSNQDKLRTDQTISWFEELKYDLKHQNLSQIQLKQDQQNYLQTSQFPGQKIDTNVQRTINDSNGEKNILKAPTFNQPQPRVEHQKHVQILESSIQKVDSVDAAENKKVKLNIPDRDEKMAKLKAETIQTKEQESMLNQAVLKSDMVKQRPANASTDSRIDRNLSLTDSTNLPLQREFDQISLPKLLSTKNVITNQPITSKKEPETLTNAIKEAIMNSKVEYMVSNGREHVEMLNLNHQNKGTKTIGNINWAESKVNESTMVGKTVITIKQVQVILGNLVRNFEEYRSEFSQYRNLKKELPQNLKLSEPIKIENLKLEIARDLKTERPIEREHLYEMKFEQAEKTKEILSVRLGKKAYENEQTIVEVRQLPRSLETVVTKVEQQQKSDNLHTIVETIKHMNNSNVERAVVDLNPPSLGKLEIQIAKQGETLNIMFKVSNDDTKELLEKSSKDLVSRLSSVGFKVESIEVRISQKAEEEHLPDGREDQHQNHQRQRREQEGEVNKDDKRDK